MVGYRRAPALHSSAVEAMTNMDYSPYRAPGVVRFFLTFADDPTMPTVHCPHCNTSKPMQKAVNQHIQLTPACKKAYNEQLTAIRGSPSPRPSHKCKERSPSLPADIIDDSDDAGMQVTDDFAPPVDSLPVQPQSKWARVEEVEDEDSAPRPCYTQFVRPYPHPVRTPIRKGKTKFETLLEQQTADGNQPWDPFVSKEEWQLAMWLMANVRQTSTDEYLKLPIVS